MKKIDELKAEIEKAEKELKNKKEELRQIESINSLKIGDYIETTFGGERLIGKLVEISGGCGYISYKVKTYSMEVTLIDLPIKKWKPKKGDFCIFWDKNRIYSVTEIINRDLNGLFETTSGVTWTNCIPFISEQQYKEHIGYEN